MTREEALAMRGAHAIDEPPADTAPERKNRRRFVTREEFAAMSSRAPAIDLDAFRADQEAAHR
jgi:hypothetical protein